MDFQSAMETFAEAWVAANTGKMSLTIPGGSGGIQQQEGAGIPLGSSGLATTTSNSTTAVMNIVSPAPASSGISTSSFQQQLGTKGLSSVAFPHAGSTSSSSTNLTNLLNNSNNIGLGVGLVGTSGSFNSSFLGIGSSASGPRSLGNSPSSTPKLSSSSSSQQPLPIPMVFTSENSITNSNLWGTGGTSTVTTSSLGGLDYHKLHSAPTCGSTGIGIDLSPTRKLKCLQQQQHQHSNSRKGSLGSGGSIADTFVNMSQLSKQSPRSIEPESQSSSHSNQLSKSGKSQASLGKSIPIHCIIEVSREYGYSGGGNKQNETSGGERSRTVSPDNSSSLSPNRNNIRGLKDNISAPINDFVGDSPKVTVEVDDFVIIPIGTPFHDLVTTVLSLLGYPKDIIRQAEGTISLRNWKPLRLDQVCDSSNKTVGDIFNDLTNHATLRVLVTRPKGDTSEDLKEKLLRLLLVQSSSLFMGANSPLDEELQFSSLLKGHWSANLAEDIKRRFDAWYSSQQHQTVSGLIESLQHQQLNNLNLGRLNHTGNGNGASNGGGVSSLGLMSPGQSSGLVQGRAHQLTNGSNERERVISAGNSSGGSNNPISVSLHGSNDRQSPTALHSHHPFRHDLHHQLSSSSGGKSSSFLMDDGVNEHILPHHHNHPVFHGLSTQKTRMRTSFDPEMELPKLQQWFAANPHPSRHLIQQYVRELNQLECRKDRKPLDVNNVIYWFKNARAAQKRNELRYNGLPVHHGNFHHHQPQHQTLSHQYHSLQTSPPVHRRRSSSQPPSNDYSDDPNNNNDNLINSNGDSLSNQRHESHFDHSDTSCHSENNGNLEKDQLSSEHIVTKEDVSFLDNGPTNEDDPVVVKEEQEEESINVDIEITDGNGISLNNEPKDLSSTSSNNSKGERDPIKMIRREELVNRLKRDHEQVEEDEKIMPDQMNEESDPTSSTSLSPRSSPGLSPSPHYEFTGGSTMLNRFHPFFDHPSFMAYRHFNSFPFGPNFSGINGSSSENGNGGNSSVVAAAAAAYEAALNGGRQPLGLPLGLAPLGLGSPGHHHAHPSPNSMSMDERRKRNRTFIDPVTEVPRLEQWFGLNTHPSHNLILKYTDELNRMPYRQKFPKLEPKNVQFWFKNRRAKCKRLKMTM